MLYRKIEKTIENHLLNSDKILIVDGARQVGKSFIIRYVGQKLYENFIEINLLNDYNDKKIFMNITNIEDFYLQISTMANSTNLSKDNTLIFLDEIEAYPHLLTMLKFLREDGRYKIIASGSLLGLTLESTVSIPIGSICIIHMYPLDFEEFLYANGFNTDSIKIIESKYQNNESLNIGMHTKILDLFKKYLIVGGLPDAVNSYIKHLNIVELREIHSNILKLYKDDAAKYDSKNKLKISRTYDYIPSQLENKKKRLQFNKIEKNKRATDFVEEFDYLINSGIALEVRAISNPKFPLTLSMSKNLLKLYLNDVGLLTNVLYKNNINAILQNEKSVNLGSVYENAVAQELKAHGADLYYYDNKKKGEVDFIINNYDILSCVPIEVKSGKDYNIHKAINTFIENEEYNIKKSIVLSDNREVEILPNGLYHLPIYYVMFIF